MSEQLASVRDPLIGVHIDTRYLVQSVIGRGGMGVVYAAVHEELQRPVAIKVLNPAWAADQDAAARFLREARVASSLSHPNIVDVWDLGRLPDGRPYLVMPRIAGQDLGSLLADEGPLHPQRAVHLLAGVASALDLIHGKGFVHRDIKPENLLYVVRDDGTEAVLVLDFGIAAAIMSESRLTKDGVLCGTPDFLPPEAASGALPDRRGDVYALATVAFELLTGRLPFLGVNPFQLLSLKLSKPAPTLTAASGRGFPEALEHVIARGLAQRPEDRYATAGEFIHALATAAAQARGEIPDLSTADTHRQLARESSFIRKTRAAAAVEAADQPPLSGQPSTAPLGAASLAPDAARAAAASPAPAPGVSQAPFAPATAPSVSARDAARPPVLIIDEDDVDALVPSLHRSRAMNYLLAALAVGFVGGGVIWALRSGSTPVVSSATSSPAHGDSARVAAAESAPPSGAAAEPAPAAPDPSADVAAASAPPPVAAPNAVRPGTPARPAADRSRAAATRREDSRSRSREPVAAVAEPPSAAEPPAEAPPATGELAPLEPSAPTAVLSIAPAAPPPPEPPASLSSPPSDVAVAAEPVPPPPPPEPPRDREQARALGERATAAMLQGQLASAVSLYQDALKADPGYAAAWRGRGLALQQVGRPREAAQAFRQFLRLEPNGPQSDMIRARLASLEQAHGL